MASTTETKPEATVGGAVVRGAVGGLVAGAVFIAVTMWFSSSLGMPANGPLQAIASIVQGESALADGTADVWVGWVVHAVLSIVYGIVLALILRGVRNDAVRAAIGLGFGAVLYLGNFHVFAPLAFEPFTMANKPFELVVHLAYGAIAVLFMLDYTWTRSARR